MNTKLNTPQNPDRKCLKVEEWPPTDREGWAYATRTADILDDSGLASHWSEQSRHKNRRGYGRWLTFLHHHQPNVLNLNPAERVTKENVRQYLNFLESHNLADYTIVGRIAELTAVISKMVPNEEWNWLYTLIGRLRSQARPKADKRPKLLPTSDLYQFGLRHMREAEQDRITLPWLRAVQYRDGLMIALLAARPLRRGNLASIRLGQHLVRRSNDWHLLFEAHEVKNRRPLEFTFPSDLAPYLERYLNHWRPHLLQDQEINNLWVTRYGQPLSDDMTYVRITKVTKRAFGTPLNPHLFRDCAATTIAIEDPEHVRSGATILGHASFKTTERNYIHATSLKAGRQFQQTLVELRQAMTQSKAKK